jgi:hypothetical protein
MRINPLVYATAMLIPFAAHSQQRINSSWPLPTDSRVRIQAPILGDKSQTGTLVTATNDSVGFQVADQPATRSLAVSDITRMEVARGTHTNRWKGALLGFAILGGAVAGYTAATWSKNDEGSQFIDFGRAGDAMFLGSFGAIIGGLTGAIVGSIQRDTWVPVRLR